MIVSNYARLKSNGKLKKVKVKDLSTDSHVRILVKCDYCNTLLVRPYRGVIHNMNNTEVRKYACRGCAPYKNKENAELKQRKGELKEGDRYYWTFRENRLKALKEYIESDSDIPYSQTKVHNAFQDYNDNVDEAIAELGYSIKDVKGKVPNGYYDDFSIIGERVTSFYDLYKRFPNTDEFVRELDIQLNYLAQFGGVSGIKQRLNITDDSFVDLSGFSNYSRYELMLANLLFANGVSFLREQNPFPKPNKRYRSDFLITKDNGEKVYIEIWGYSNHRKRGICEFYNAKRKLKEDLYLQYNHTLLSIEEETFLHDFDTIQQNLIELVSPYLDKPLSSIERNLFVSSISLTDEKILEFVLSSSGDGKSIPACSVFRKRYSFVYKQMLERYGSYSVFLDKMKKETNVQKHNFWNKERFEQTFFYMVREYGKVLSIRDLRKCKDVKLIGFLPAIQKRMGWDEGKLWFYERCLEENVSISDYDIENLRKMSMCIYPYTTVSFENQERSRTILHASRK
jgi:hypothetical protein